MTVSPTFRHFVELKREGRLPEALQKLEEALAARPGDLFLMAALADTLIRMKKLVPARQVIDELLAKDPDHQPGLTALGELHLAQGRLRDSLEAFRLASVDSHTGAIRTTPYLARRQASVLVRLGELERADELLRQALASHPDDRGLSMELARVLAKRQKHAEALELLEGLAATHPEDRPIKSMLVEARASSRPAEEASRELDMALSTGAGRSSPDLWKLKARQAAAAGQWPSAAESYLAAHRLDPDSSYYIQQAGFAFRRARDLTRAVECLEPEFLQDPTNRYVRAALFATFKELGERTRLVELLDRAIARHPDLVELIGLRKRHATPPSPRSRAARRRRPAP